MNLPKLAKCIILIWLPLANLELHGKNAGGGNDGKNSRIEEKMEEKSVEPEESNYLGKEIFGDSSANSGKRLRSNSKSEKKIEKKSAHKLACNLMKSPSALIIDNNINNNSNNNAKEKSATAMLSYRGRKKSKRKLLEIGLKSQGRNWGKSGKEVFKREVPEIPESTVPIDYYDDDSKEDTDINDTGMGSYLGGPCEFNCSQKLLNVFCDPKKKICECKDNYPVRIDSRRGCEKPKQLGDQCFYSQTCSFFDPNAVCTQINHNAVCQCKPGFHTVALRKGVKKMFCSEDVVAVSANLPTLLGVATGIALLTGLLCFVLRLFSGNRYPATRHYGNANLPPPLLLSNDNQWINGIPLTVQGRSSSRSSCQRSIANLAQYSRSKGVLVPASRAGAARAAAILLIPCHLQASRHSEPEVVRNGNKEEVEVAENDLEQSSRIGSRRPSTTSIHSTTSSQKSISYSARRFEQENQQREQRAAMKAAREEAAKMATLSPTPSPSSTENVLLIEGSHKNEGDFRSSALTDSPAHTQPPELIEKGSIETPSSNATSGSTNNLI